MWTQIREARRNEDGFTLIELLIVIVILGVLAGIVVFAVNGIQNKGEVNACQSDVKTVTVAAEAYYAQKGDYAADIAALKAAGLIHSEPTDVSYVVNAGPPKTVTVKGAAASKCPAFEG